MKSPWCQRSVLPGSASGALILLLLLSTSSAGATVPSFTRHLVLEPEAAGAAEVLASDLDGDGDQDLLLASSNTDEIAWYENLSAAPEGAPGTFQAPRVITRAADGAWSVHAADLDGDGDLDVLSASPLDDEIAWYENLTAAPDNAPGAFGPQQIISTAADQAQGVFAADLDGDGDMDVLSASAADNKIAWYENLGAAPDSTPGSFGPQQIISTAANGAWSVHAADLDGDGDLDVLSSSVTDDKIAWYENLTAAPSSSPGTFAAQRILTTAANFAMSVRAADLDGDGDLDVLSASQLDDEIAWYENLTAAPDSSPGIFGPQQIITTLADGARAVRAADVDGDGDLDVLSASTYDDTISWFENLTAAPDSAPGTFAAERVITTAADGANSVFAADLDGDADLDLLSASGNDSKLAWYEGLTAAPDSAPGTFGPPTKLKSEVLNLRSVHAADLDGDGDADVLSASRDDDKIAWYENRSAAPDSLSGTFWPQRVITSAAAGATSVFAADLDGDGDADVLAAAYDGDAVTWFENLTAGPDNTPGTFGPQALISSGADGASAVHAVDLDGDGDLDVLSASFNDDKIAWYENLSAAPDGQPGAFGPQQVITTLADGARSVHAADLDGDGDADVLAAAYNGDAIFWFENRTAAPQSAPGTFGARRTISAIAEGAMSVFAADLDGDGDLDVLSASTDRFRSGGVEDKIAWYENLSAAPDSTPGSFGPQGVLALGTFEGTSVFAADLDADGDLDVLSASAADDRIAYFENYGAAPEGAPGTFSSVRTISTTADAAYSVYATDVDGDGDTDVLAASFLDNELAWYENLYSACSVNPCMNGGVCTEQHPGFSCDCSGTGYVGATCSDIDECATNNGDCGDPASWLCTNNDGAPQTCSDIDECAANTDDCDVNATCLNATGTFSCTCNTGYSGDGRTCLLDACAPVAASDVTCDGADDDCSGEADEDYASDASCGVGACRTGNAPSTCAGGVEIACVPGAPTAEQCGNAVDDDCDGLVDAEDSPDCPTAPPGTEGSGCGCGTGGGSPVAPLLLLVLAVPRRMRMRQARSTLASSASAPPQRTPLRTSGREADGSLGASA